MTDVTIEMNIINSNENKNKNISQINIIECCICLDECQKQEIKMECCSQNIHKSCLLEWIVCQTNNENCPLCRTDISDITKIYTIEDFLNKMTQINCKKTTKNIEKILNKWFKIDNIYIPDDTNTRYTESINYSQNSNRIHTRQYIQNCLCIMITIFIVMTVTILTIRNNGKSDDKIKN